MGPFADIKHTPPTSVQTNFGGKKISKLPPLMEAASERGFLEENPEQEHRDAAGHKSENCGFKAHRSRVRSLRWSVTSPASREVSDVPSRPLRPSNHSLYVQEAKLLRQQTGKRSRSAGQVLSNPSVRIPPVLQLEKKVLKVSLGAAELDLPATTPLFRQTCPFPVRVKLKKKFAGTFQSQLWWASPGPTMQTCTRSTSTAPKN